MHASDQPAPAIQRPSKLAGKNALPAIVTAAEIDLVEPQLDCLAQVDKFMRDFNWVHHFLPTLTHALYTSLSPFKHFMKQSSQFLKTTQATFDLSFPTVTFVLHPNDKIITEVCTGSHLCYYFKYCGMELTVL